MAAVADQLGPWDRSSRYTMSDAPATSLVRLAPAAGVTAFLRRRSVAVALLLIFTFLVGVVSQRLFASIDEGYQYTAALFPIPYIVTHNPQDHPFYGVLVHLAMEYL